MDDSIKISGKIVPEKVNNDLANGKTDWKILIVDDEEAIHNITKRVLNDLVFQGRKISFISAHSGAEAKKIIESNPDTAVILLDIVMEEKNSGLEVANYIRNELRNNEVRIILRTAYPGSAPEKNIIINYDINDYKDKTELFSQKLVTCVIAALRSYKDLHAVNELNRELENKVTEKTKQLEVANLKLEEALKQLNGNKKAGKKSK
jgi:sigma-B regulation protein RsbU (phosphoserine phosphatase)